MDFVTKGSYETPRVITDKIEENWIIHLIME